MKQENLSTLKIHRLTQEQYDRVLQNGNIDENALYLTPNEENTKFDEIDRNISTINTSIDNIENNYETKNDANEKLEETLTYIDSQLTTKLASKADKNHNHDDSYDAKGSASEVLDSAKAYIDGAISDLVSDSDVDSKIESHNDASDAHNDIRNLIQHLSNSVNSLLDDDTKGKLEDIIALIDENKGTLESLTSGKINVADIVDNLTTGGSNKVLSAAQGVVIQELIDTLQNELDNHTHSISDVDNLESTLTNLQSTLDDKANKSHGTHVSYSTTAPVMDGDAYVGKAATVARSDHKHPTDTSRASKEEFDAHTSNTTSHITATERSHWNDAKNHADSAHAPSNAEKNQNAFSKIAVSGQTTVAAAKAVDTLNFDGSNVSITTDATKDKVTFSVANGSTTTHGIVKLEDSTSSTSTTTAATPNSVKSAYDLAYQAKTAAANAQSTADGKAALSHNHAASDITAGTLAGQVLANASAVSTVGTAQVRNISAGTTDMTAGKSTLKTGDIYFVYEL